MLPPCVPAQSAPPTSQRAIEILDELRISLLECVLVLAVLPEESGLLFGGLSEHLDAAHRGARDAHLAAGMLRYGADIGSCGDDRGYRHPHTFLLEQENAVRQGASPGVIVESLVEHIERRVWEPITEFDTAHPRPRCVVQTEPDGQRCTAEVLRRDVESFGQRCYRHANDDERRLDWTAEAEAQEQERVLVAGYQHAFGREIANEWLGRRKQSPRWFNRTRAGRD